MWNELAMLRRLAPPEHEFKITAVTARPVEAEFTTGLTGGQGRTGLYVQNKSDSSSGECFWGDASLTPANGWSIPVGAVVEILIPPNQNPHFCSSSGEIGDLRVLEVS